MRTRVCHRLLLALFALILGSASIALTFFPASRFSAAERRFLAPFPTLRADRIANGDFSRDLDSYAGERAPFRSICRHVWSAAELALLPTESHGVLLCRDGSLSKRISVDEDVLQGNLSALSHVRGKLGETSLAVGVVPSRAEARREVLPPLYEPEAIASALLPDDVLVFDDVTQDSEWFRTDHHWTASGAFSAYTALGEILGYEPYGTDTFTKQLVSDHFLGSSAATSGLPFVRADDIVLWRYEGDSSLCVKRDGVPADFTGLYDLEAIEGCDEYSVFLGGNCAITEIDAGEDDTRPVLLVLKDSFGNSLLPFLARHYRVIAIDPRYRPTELSSLFSRADKALVLCGIQTIGSEAFLTPLLRQ